MKLLGESKEEEITPGVVVNKENDEHLDEYPILSPRSSAENVSVHANILNKIQSEPIELPENIFPQHVTENVYLSYITAGGNVLKLIFFTFIFIFAQILMTGSDFWITFWYCILFFYYFLVFT